jgi:hypothetical protein
LRSAADFWSTLPLLPVGSCRLNMVRSKLPPGAHVEFDFAVEARARRDGVVGAGRAVTVVRRKRTVAGSEGSMVVVGMGGDDGRLIVQKTCGAWDGSVWQRQKESRNTYTNVSQRNS